ncbi:hypothetical protein [Candidatus Pantoea persica]
MEVCGNRAKAARSAER